MKNKPALFILFPLTFFTGIFLGKTLYQKSPNTSVLQSVPAKEVVKGRVTGRKEVTRKERMKVPEDCQPEVSLNDNRKEKVVVSFEKYNAQRGFDAYEARQVYNESIRAWNNSVRTLFQDHTEYPKKKYSEYQKLKLELDEEMKDHWTKIKERTRVGENEFLFNSTFKDDLEQMNIRVKYHKRLKRLLGKKVYELMQEKIKLNGEKRVQDARDGKYEGAHIDF